MEHRLKRVVKQQSSIMLILLLLALLVLWWELSSVRAHPEPLAIVSASPLDATLGSVRIVQNSTKKKLTLSGTVPVSNCETFSTNLSAVGAARVTLGLVITKADLFCADTSTSSVPFSVSYASPGAGAAVLAGVSVNSRSVPFSITTTHN